MLTAEGATEIDCVVVHIENPNDEKALNVALNKAVGEWEPKALTDLLSDLQLAGYDVGATGFDAAEIDDLFSKVHDKDVKDDDTKLDPETITPFVRSGDLWTLGKQNTYSQDSSVTLSGNSFYVRDEQDIHSLAIEIAALTKRQQRGRGLRMS